MPVCPVVFGPYLTWSMRFDCRSAASSSSTEQGSNIQNSKTKQNDKRENTSSAEDIRALRLGKVKHTYYQHYRDTKQHHSRRVTISCRLSSSVSLAKSHMPTDLRERTQQHSFRKNINSCRQAKLLKTNPMPALQAGSQHEGSWGS